MAFPPPQREDAADAATKPGTADLNFWFSIVECVDPKMVGLVALHTRDLLLKLRGQIDFERFAEMCGYKNVKTAKWMFYWKRRQLREVQGAAKVRGGGEKGVKKEKKKGAVKREAKEVGIVKREVKKEEKGVVKREVKEEEKGVVKREAKEEVEE